MSYDMKLISNAVKSNQFCKAEILTQMYRQDKLSFFSSHTKLVHSGTMGVSLAFMSMVWTKETYNFMLVATNLT